VLYTKFSKGLPVWPDATRARISRYFALVSNVSVHHDGGTASGRVFVLRKEEAMSETKSHQPNSTLSRREMLVASTTLAATSVLATVPSVKAAEAQTQDGPALAQAAPGQLEATPTQTAQAPGQPSSSTRPNVLVVMGDDIGWFNIGA
jgi:hypothetical protein